MEGKLTMTEDQLNDFFDKNEIPEEITALKEEATNTEDSKDEMTFDQLYDDSPSVETKNQKPVVNNNKGDDEKDLLLKQIEFFKKKQYLPDDFALPADEELTQELFGEVLEYSSEYLKDKFYEEAIDSTGKQGKAIIEYINNGGNPERIIDLFRSQQQTQFSNTETIEGQKKIVTDYYKEQEWSDDDIEELIDVKINSDKLKKEAERIKLKRDAESERKIGRELENQQNQKLKEIQITNNRKSQFAETLKSDYKQTDIRNILSYVFDENSDNNLTDFELRILDIQKKPNELKDLVEYLVNPDVFIKRKAIAIQNKKTETTWSKINSAKSKRSDSEQIEDSKKSSWIFNN